MMHHPTVCRGAPCGAMPSSPSISGAVLVICRHALRRRGHPWQSAPVSGLDLAVAVRAAGRRRDAVRRDLRLGRLATRRCREGWARAIFAADIVWVAASALVLVLPASWTTAGIAGIAWWR